MGVRENRSARRESIDARRFDLRVTAEAADPIVEIIDRDEEDVGAISGASARDEQ